MSYQAAYPGHAGEIVGAIDVRCSPQIPFAVQLSADAEVLDIGAALFQAEVQPVATLAIARQVVLVARLVFIGNAVGAVPGGDDKL